MPSAMAAQRAKPLIAAGKTSDPKLGSGVRRTARPRTEGRQICVDLGRSKEVMVVRPPLAEGELSEEEVEAMTLDEVTARFGHLTGAGDVVWPAGLAFARLLAHCPSFVAGKRVLELGTGLGAVGLTAARAGAAAVTLSDYDEDVLHYATQAAHANGVAGIVSTARLDWTADTSAVDGVDALLAGADPDGFELVLGADVLYAEQNARHIATLLPRLLTPSGRCMIADQTQWPWRADFHEACARSGLVVEEIKLPAPEDIRLLTIFRDAPNDMEE